MVAESRRPAPAWALLLVGLPLYLAADRAGYAYYLSPESISAFWAASGIAVGVLYLLPPPWWLPFVLATYGLDVLAARMQGESAVVGFASFSAQLEMVLGAGLLRAFVGRGLDVTRLVDLLKLIGVALVATAAAALLGAWRFVRFQPEVDYLAAWQVWWLADALGVLVFAPLVLAWTRTPRIRWNALHVTEMLVALALVALAGVFVFGGEPEPFRDVADFPFIVFPVLVYLAFRAVPQMLTLAIAAIAVLVVWTAAEGRGPFVLIAGESIQANVLAIQTFLLVVTVSTLILQAALSERRRAVRGQIRAAAEIARCEQLSRFAARMAHDLNNDLFTIRGNVELAAAAPAEEERVRFASNAVGSVRRSAELAQRLVDLGTGEESSPAVLSIPDYARAVEPVLRTALGPRHRLALRERTERRIRVDPFELDRALINLTLNAREAMPGGGTLAIRFLDDDEGSGVRIEVEDDGVGIEPSLLDRVFDPLVTTKPGGSGLGLASVRSIVNRAGGTVTVRSRPGVGTTFTLRLPAAEEGRTSGDRAREPAPASRT